MFSAQGKPCNLLEKLKKKKSALCHHIYRLRHLQHDEFLHFTQNQSPVIRYTQKHLDEIFHDVYSLFL